jgi:carbamoyltransferase
LRILGISAFYHDSAAVLVDDGRIVAAAQEERFSRKKHDAGLPTQAVAFCLQQAGCELDDLDFVVFYEKPLLKFDRLLETYLSFAPFGFRSFAAAIPLWTREKLFHKNALSKLGRFDWKQRLLFSEHHLSHASSAFFVSPFSEAAILTMDGVGEWATTSIAFGKGNAIEVRKEINFPHSLGLLYSAFTYYLGFKVNSGEYKVMGLAPYGTPRHVQPILDHLIDLKPDGSFWLDQSYFDYAYGLRMTNEKFHALFGGPPRNPESEVTRREMDLAASIQAVLNEAVLAMARSAAAETGSRNLCMAGGVALNCVANGDVLRSGLFENIWIQPAPGDAGGALGAALNAYYIHQKSPRFNGGRDTMNGAYLGPEFSVEEIQLRLAKAGAKYRLLSEPDLCDACAGALAEGKVLGWFQGRMEFGPRALGARSILADPRSPSMQATLNAKIKYRESFRPFAPSVPREDVSEWFEFDGDSPYMLFTASVRPEKQPRIPAVTHVDGSARVQTVREDTNPLYYRLLKAFYQCTGCAVLVNTSFNIRGEPIVCTPEDAFRCFMGTELDALAIGNCFLEKEGQDSRLLLDYAAAFDAD